MRKEEWEFLHSLREFPQFGALDSGDCKRCALRCAGSAYDSFVELLECCCVFDFCPWGSGELCTDGAGRKKNCNSFHFPTSVLSVSGSRVCSQLDASPPRFRSSGTPSIFRLQRYSFLFCRARLRGALTNPACFYRICSFLPILLVFAEVARSCRSCCKCHSIMQITARRVSLIIRELRGTSARGEAKLVSPRDLVKCKCLTNNDLCFTSSRGEFQKFYCPVEFPYCIFVRNILLLRFSGPKSENNPLFCFSHFLM